MRELIPPHISKNQFVRCEKEIKGLKLNEVGMVIKKRFQRTCLRLTATEGEVTFFDLLTSI